jgi:hypothetical protein
MIGSMLLLIPLALLAGLAGGLISRLFWPVDQAKGQPGPVRTTNLSLVDDRGRQRAVLTLIGGRPMLVLSDELSQPTGDTILRARLAVGILKDGAPGLELADGNGKKRALFSVTADGVSLLELTVRNSNARATLNAPTDGNASLEFFDRTGTRTAQWS